MKIAPCLSLAVIVMLPEIGSAQVGGNVSYAQGNSPARARAEHVERNKRILSPLEIPPTNTSTFIEANILMNVKADEYVAVFSIAREGETVEDAARKMDATVKAFIDALKPLGIDPADPDLDFIAQNKIYGFDIDGNLAKEKLAGFEIKKNISISYGDKSDLDRLVAAAARSEVFDLVKVDYFVKDLGRVHDRLAIEAARILKKKKARYEDLLDLKLSAPTQVYADRVAVHYPTRLYDTYTAQESEQVNGGVDRQRFRVQSVRKPATFYFNGLDADGFDEVINPVVIEPVIQFTLYQKVRYEVEPAKVK